MKVAVIGAGIAGATIAAELKGRGHEVTVFDGKGIANECSFANGGQLSVCNAEVWNTWKNVGKGLKWLFDKEAPLRLNLLPTPSKIAWLAEFLKHTAMDVYERNTIETIQLGLLSRDRYFDFHKINENPEFTGYVPSAMMHVYSNLKSYKAAESSANLFALSDGSEWLKMTDRQILAYDDNLRHFKSLQGGYITEQDSTIDINRLCQFLLRNIEFIEQDVEDIFRFNNGIHLTLQDGSTHVSDRVVIATGHHANRWAPRFGNWFNMYPVKGYSISIEGDRDSGFPYVSLLDDDKKIVSSTFEYEDGRCVFRVAGTAEIGSKKNLYSDKIQRRHNPLLNWVYDNFDVDPNCPISYWSCARPMMADMMPFYDRSRVDDRIFYHIGHGHLGLTLAAGTAYLLANKITEEEDKTYD